MFAQLGHIRFERTTYFSGLEGNKGFGFAEHATVEGKPRLQGVGDPLDSLTVDMRFEREWCSPQEVYDKLVEVSARKEAMALVFGDGTYRGRFVVTEIVDTYQHCAPDGTLQKLDVRVQLKEWVDDKPLEAKRQRQVAQAPARKPAGGKPPASAKKGTPAYTVQTTTNKDGFSVTKIVRR